MIECWYIQSLDGKTEWNADFFCNDQSYRKLEPGKIYSVDELNTHNLFFCKWGNGNPAKKYKLVREYLG